MALKSEDALVEGKYHPVEKTVTPAGGVGSHTPLAASRRNLDEDLTSATCSDDPTWVGDYGDCETYGRMPQVKKTISIARKMAQLAHVQQRAARARWVPTGRPPTPATPSAILGPSPRTRTAGTSNGGSINQMEYRVDLHHM